MNSQPNPQGDRKLLFVVAGCVVAGAIGVAIVAGLAARDEGAATPGREEPTTAIPRERAATRPVEAVVTGETCGDDPWQEGLSAYAERAYATAAAYLAIDAERRPDRAYTHYMLGLALWKCSRLEEAALAMERSAALNERSIRTFVNLARIRLAQGDADAALDGAERALALDPGSSSALYQKARGLYATSRADEAVAVLEQCVEIDPAAGEAHNLLGLIRLRRGDPIAALQSLEVAAALLPDVAHAQNNYGLALEGAGRFAEAAVAFRRASEADPEHDAARVSLARVEAHGPEAAEAPIEVARTAVENSAVVPDPGASAVQEVRPDPGSD